MQKSVARIVRRGGGRERDTVPSNGVGSWLKYAAGKADVEIVQALVADILQSILGCNVNPRLGLRPKGDENLLLFDDVTRPQSCSAGNKSVGRRKQRGDEQRTGDRRALQDQTIVMARAKSAKDEN